MLRSKRMPLFPLYTSGIGFQYMDGNTMKSFHKDSIGFMLEMQALFEDLPNDRCSVTVTYRIDTHPVFKILELLFKELFKKWFWATWEEDAPMRLRRWKVHKLPFKDFSGIEYINKKLPEPEDSNLGSTSLSHPSESLRRSKRRKAWSGPSITASNSDTRTIEAVYRGFISLNTLEGSIKISLFSATQAASPLLGSQKGRNSDEECCGIGTVRSGLRGLPKKSAFR